MRVTLPAVIFLSLSVCALADKKLPSFIKKCKRSDPKLDECVKNAILNAKPYLKEGIKELRVPPMAPFVLDKAKLYTGYATSTFSDIKFYQGNNFELTYFKIDLETNTIALNVTYPYMELTCLYIADGKFINIAFHGEGDMRANFTNTNVTTVLHGEREKKNGQEYITWKTTDTHVLEDSMEYFHVSDLFRGNPELSERLLEVFREQQKDLTPEIIPLVADIFGQVFLSWFNGPFSKFSLKELFDD